MACHGPRSLVGSVAVLILAKVLGPYSEGLYRERVLCRERVPLTPGDQTDPVVHVVYSTDAQNFVGLLSSLLSLVRHMEDPGACEVHVLVDSRDVGAAARLVQCLRHEVSGPVPTVSLHELRPLTFNLSGSPYVSRGSLLKAQTFARLYLHEYLPAVHRAIWLDHDVIVNSSLRPLYRMEMRHAVAGTLSWDCPHARLENWQIPAEIMKEYSINPHAPQIHTGVLLFDLDRWRAENLTASVVRWLQRLGMVEGEMMAMNIALQDDVDILDWSWNNFRMCVFKTRAPAWSIAESKVFHWAGNLKPWHAEVARDYPYACHFDLFEPYLPKKCGVANFTV